jgi:hypothetical protein
MKTCPKCGLEKPDSSFYKKLGGLSSSCKACAKLYSNDLKVRARSSVRNKRKYAEVPEERIRQKNYQRLRNTGWTPKAFEAAWMAQDGKCAICGRTMLKYGNYANSVHSDHSHITGEPRGLPCHSCNRGLGLFGDNPDTLESACQYLRKHEFSPLRPVSSG